MSADLTREDLSNQQLSMSNGIVVESKRSITPDEESYIKRRNAYDEIPDFRVPQVPIQVIVGKGQDKTSFIIYRDFLTYYSPYFKSALMAGNFKESEGVIELDHVSPDPFGLFVEWLYTQQVKDRKCMDMSIEDEAKRELKDTPTIDDLVSLWILADYLQCPNLQNRTIELIILKDSRRKSFNTGCIVPAYDNTLPGSPLRKVFVDICFWRGPDKSWFISHSEEFPKELLLELVVLYTGDKGRKCPLHNNENYHVKENE